MDKNGKSKGKKKGGELKKRLKGVRRRKRVQERLGRDAGAFRMRLVEARGRIGR